MDVKELLSIKMVEAVQEVFSVNLSLVSELTEQEVIFETNRNIFCFIKVTGKITGRMDLLISEFDALSIASTMLGVDVDEDSLEVNDAIGEIVNMLIGALKMKLTGTEYSFELDIPDFDEKPKKEAAEGGELISQNFVAEDLRFQILFEYKISTGEEEKKNSGDSQGLSATDLLLQAMGQEVPAPAAETEASPEAEVVEQAKDESKGLKNAKFVIVHEDKFEKQSIESVLTKGGCSNVVLASNAQEGLDQVKTEKPDVVIIDGFLNDRSGADLCKDIKSIENIPSKIIMLIDNEKSFIKNIVNDVGIEGFYVNAKGYEQLIGTLENIV